MPEALRVLNTSQAMKQIDEIPAHLSEMRDVEIRVANIKWRRRTVLPTQYFCLLLPSLLSYDVAAAAFIFPACAAPHRTCSKLYGDQQSSAQTVKEAGIRLKPAYDEVDRRTQTTLRKIIDAYRKHQVGTHLFGGIDGYGHGDIGRDTLEAIFADLFGAEAALMFSGTHAISCALFGVLRPGDMMLGISGRPYDTLEQVIGLRDAPTLLSKGATEPPSESNLRPLTGSMAEWGIGYQEINLLQGRIARFDLPAIDAAIAANASIRVLHIQRSCGYQWRPSIHIDEIAHVIQHVKRKWRERELIVFVDNCYGEFVEDLEPTHVGADLVAGSLIKNPGGTLAPTGGYVIGKRPYVAAAYTRLSAPGVEGGATLGKLKALYQGLFLAPSIIGESLKGAMLVAEVLGNVYKLPCNPPPGAARTDIIQAVQVGTRDRVVALCQQVQRWSPVGAHIQPVAGLSPGYGDEVIFAVGTFVDGSTLELSADGPLREPYTVFLQGCTTHLHWAIVLEDVLKVVDMNEQQQRSN